MALQNSQEGKDIGNYLTNDHWPHCFDYLRRVSLNGPLSEGEVEQFTVAKANY